MQKALPFNKLQKTTLYEEVMQQIKKAILRGEYKPGDYLPPERELAEIFGVGRPTIREALKILRERQLLKLDWNTRKYIVRMPDLGDCVLPIQEQISWLIQVSENTIGDFWEVIPHIVGLTAHGVLGKKTDECIQRLSANLKGMEESGQDFFVCCRVSYLFGLDLAEMSGNRLILLLWKIFDNVIKVEFPHVLAVMEPKGSKNLVDFHRRILEGIQNGSQEIINKAVMDRTAYLKSRLPFRE